MKANVYDNTNQARDELFSSLGVVDSDVIAPIVNPSFMGGPQWPSLRQAFSVIRTNESIKIVSNGLSDPFEDIDEPNNGFRVEIVAETKNNIGSDVPASWLFKLVYSMSQQVACSGQIADFVANHGVITMELFAKDIGLEDYQNENGMIGVMLGVKAPKIPKVVKFPAEEIILTTVQLLTPDELEYAINERAEGRKLLHGLMQSSGVYHFINLDRSSLLQNEDKNHRHPWWQFWKKG